MKGRPGCGSAWLGVVGLLLSVSASAQPGGAGAPVLRFDHLTVEDGLSHNSVYAVLQDRAGYLWFGTENGLNRYDGYAFTVYRHDPNDPNSLSHDWVNDLHEDAGGHIWVATDDGVSIFDPATETFTRLVHDPHDANSLPAPVVREILEDPDGSYWLGTAWGLSRYDPATRRFKNYVPGGAPAHPEDAVVEAIARDSSGVFWVGTWGTGLYRFDPQSESFANYRHDQAPHSLPDDMIRALAPAEDGTLWVGTRTGLCHFDPATARCRNYAAGTAATITETVLDLYRDREGTLWAGTDRGGLKRYDARTATFASYQHEPSDPAGLSFNEVYALYEDRLGTFWVGVAHGGVNRVDLRSGAFPRYRYSQGHPGSLGSDNVTALYADPQQPEVIWIGTGQAGLDRLDRSTGRITHFDARPNDPGSLSNGFVEAIYRDRGGALWVGTRGGLNRLDAGGRTFTPFLGEGNWWIRFIYEAPSEPGVLWLANGFYGLTRFETATGRYQHFNLGFDDLNAGVGWVAAIVEGRDGQLWLATEGSGLVRFDRAQGTYRQFRHEAGEPSSLLSDKVFSLYQDADGVFWAGTDRGFCRFDPEAGTYTHYTPAGSALPSETVYGILPDDAGGLWMSTLGGLVRFEPTSGAMRVFGPDRGVQGRAFNPFAYARAASGELFFGGPNGFNAFFPGGIRTNPHPPLVHVTGVDLFERGAGSGEALVPLPLRPGLALAHDENDLSFRYVGLHYSNPARNRYAYRLRPYEDRWHDAGNQRTAIYTNLDPGTYVFEVRAASRDGVWSDNAASVTVVIHAPWWATAWFRVFAAAGLLGLAFAAYAYRVRNLKARERELTRQVAERTAEIRDKNTQLEAQTLQLRELDEAKSRFFANISHEFRTPLTIIIGLLEDLRHDGPGMEKTAVEEMTNLALRSARRLLRLIGQLLDISKLEAGPVPLHVETRDVVGFVRDIVRVFEPLAARRGLGLHYVTPEQTFTARFDAEKLEKVIANLLSNAFKFTPEGGTVRVKVGLAGAPASAGPASEAAAFEVEVRDSGIGIPPEALPRVFDRFYQVESSQTRHYQGTGIGLALSKEFVELHGGTISVESEPGFGTTFTVRMPRLPQTDAEMIEGGRNGASDEQSGEALAQAVEEETDLAPADAGEGEGDGSGEAASAGGDDRPVVLVVDDHPDLRAYIRRRLEGRFRVEEAANGAAGLKKARALTPDIVVSDVMMPEMDGIAFCNALRADPALAWIPIILLTARATDEHRLEGLKAGADAYLPKPFDVAELQVWVDNLLAMGRRLRERLQRETLLHAKPIAAQPAGLAFLEKVNEVVEAHLADVDFGVEEMADEMAMSRAQLYRKVTAETGLSPVAYLRRFRIERATQLLRAGTGNIGEVAYAVGFNSVSYFGRVFREHHGMSPSAFVEQLEDHLR